MAATNHNQCLVCAKDCGDVVCELCESVPYCSDECEAADFVTHRHVCRFKQWSLDCQNLCAVCDKAFSATNVSPVLCNNCFGIKYCSTQCQRDNQAEHNILCNAYASIPLRPSIDHRLHLFFHANQAQPRFLWLTPEKPSRHAVINPHALDIESSYRTGKYNGDESYKANLYHTAAFLSSRNLVPNWSLGTVTGLPPLKSMKGNALLGMKHDDISLPITHVLPSVLPRVVAAYQKKEIQHQHTHNPRTGVPQSAVPY